MYAYQGDHEDSIVEEFKSAKIVLDGSEAGSGKSRMSATVCKKMGYRGFVLCSKTALSFWVEELKAIGIKFDVVNYETFKGGHIFKSNGSHTTSFERVKFTTFEPNTLVIFDEIHVCKNDTQRREMLQDILNHPIKLLGLSATVPKVNDFLPPCKVFKVGFKSSFTNTVNWTNRFT
jgi:superfamily II DNA or RNA helicase